jgi:hypothetical protein
LSGNILFLFIIGNHYNLRLTPTLTIFKKEKKLERKNKKKDERENFCWFDGKSDCLFGKKGYVEADEKCITCQYFDKKWFISKYYNFVYPLE